MVDLPMWQTTLKGLAGMTEGARDPTSASDQGLTGTNGTRARALAWLEMELRHGPRDSSELHEGAAQVGISPKLLRTAREALSLEVKRSGFGPAIRSTWALPESSKTEHVRPDRCQRAREDVSPSNGSVRLTDGEDSRTTRRVRYFGTKGLDQSTAIALAHQLVVERDRAGSSLTSCAECQNYVAPGQCRARMEEGCGEGSRGVFELWNCYLARIVVS